MPLRDAIGRRESRRTFSDEPLSFDELSFLLWATQGIRKIHPQRVWAMRTVPSGGCRHPMETYLWVRNVDRVPPGLYRYLPLEHALVDAHAPRAEALPSLAFVCCEQTFVDQAAVTFCWTAIPYRTEWRYGPDSLKDILLSCGHICQNLYLACESIGAGTCAIVAYDQDALDAFLGVDGKDEISLYVAPVGKIPG
jgi:SagB-type dehydrogenase family enzyme